MIFIPVLDVDLAIETPKAIDKINGAITNNINRNGAALNKINKAFVTYRP